MGLAIFYFIIMVWGVATTIYGLYLSKRNNDYYNKRIVELLEAIKERLAGSDLARLDDLNRVEPPKSEIKEFKIKLPGILGELFGGRK